MSHIQPVSQPVIQGCHSMALTADKQRIFGQSVMFFQQLPVTVFLYRIPRQKHAGGALFRGILEAQIKLYEFRADAGHQALRGLGILHVIQGFFSNSFFASKSARMPGPIKCVSLQPSFPMGQSVKTLCILLRIAPNDDFPMDPVVHSHLRAQSNRFQGKTHTAPAR